MLYLLCFNDGSVERFYTQSCAELFQQLFGGIIYYTVPVIEDHSYENS